jgi:molybdopterin-guanine dinucleotide biosynthesis protein B
MKVLHIVGRKNHGKTMLMTDLVGHLSRTGHRVGAIKHCGHEHALDVPGKDSTRYCEAGASIVAVMTPSRMAVHCPRPAERDPYDYLRGHFEACEVVLIEGDTDGPGPKIEVWRAEVGAIPLIAQRYDIRGVVTNDPLMTDRPVWARDLIPELASAVLDLAEEV